MAVDVAVPRADRALVLARVASIPAQWVLAGAVAVSFAVRWLMAFAHTTPLYFADEYIYSTLAYELAQTGRPTIRGEAASFPALLEPILTAPFWLSGDPELALRLTQGLNAFAMSLAAIPVYLLARKLGLGKGFALGSAALALVVPDLFYVSFILGEPIAYPLVLAAVYAGVCALDRPTRRAQGAFVAFSGLATFARVQFVVLPLAFLGAALLLERGNVRRLASRFRLALGLLALPVAAALVLGPGRVVGYYRDIADFDLHPLEFAGWLATDAMLLAYAAGWVLLPGALIGFALAIWRPATRVERAFGAFAALLTVALFVEAGLYAVNASLEPGGRFQERYLFTILPLLAPAFGLYLRRPRPYRGAVAIIAFGLLAVSARIPLAGYTSSHARQDSPFLIGVYRVEKILGYANGSALIALAVGVLSLVAVGLALRRGKSAAPIGLGLTAVFLSSVSLGAFSYDRTVAERARATYLPADARWVDHADVGEVTLLNTPGALRELALEQMFWNRSITDFALLRRAERVDAFGAPRVRIGPDGALFLRGKALRRPLLFNRYAMAAEFVSAERVARTNLFDLWRPAGTPRLALLAGGRYYDGWLAYAGWLKVWPSTRGVEGRLRLRLTLPAAMPPTTIRFRGPGLDRRVTFVPGRSRVVEFAASQQQAWTLQFRVVKGGAYLSDGRAVSVRAAEFRFERGLPAPL